MLSDYERAYLRWMNQMAAATKTLPEHLDASLSAWLAAGEKRSTWPGWVQLIGAKPEEPGAKKLNGLVTQMGKRKSA